MSSPPDSAKDRTVAAVSFWLLIGMIATIGAGKAILSDSLDPDLFWHLRVAEQLRTDGVGPIVDHLSYNSIKEPWTPYSWLAELGMKWMWDHLGWRSAVACKAIVVAGIIVMIGLCALTLGGHQRRLNCVLATAFGAFFSIPFLSFRPATFAILLLGICAWLLLRDRKRQSRSVWLILPLTFLITNLHLSSIVVPIWVGCLLIGSWNDRHAMKRYAMLLAATVLACLATPMLPGAIRTAWYYQSNDVMVNSPIIAEMRPVYSGAIGIVAVALLAGLLIVAFIHRRQLRLGEWLWLLAAMAMTFRLGRFAPMLAFIAAPVLAVTLPAMNDRALRKPSVAIALGLVLLMGIGRTVLGFPRSDTPMDTWVNRHLPSYPTAAATWLEANATPHTHRLINEFNWGGYLEWRLGDRYQTFLDGRTQLFTTEFWRKTYLGNDEDAAAVIRAADAGAAIIPRGRSQFRAALQSLGWQSVYHDDVAEVLVHP